MSESQMVIGLLSVISACGVVMAMTGIIAVGALRRTLRRIDDMIPHCEEAFREADRTLIQARRLILHTNRITRGIASVLHDACSLVSDAIDGVAVLKEHTQTLFAKHLRFGNGVRAASHRHRRG